MDVLLGRGVVDPPGEDVHLDVGGTVLSALGLGLVVMAILKSGSWGFVQPQPEAPTIFGLSPVIWMGDRDGALPRLGEPAGRAWARVLDRPLDAAQPPTPQRRRAFLFMFLALAGLFFAVPLFLSVALGLSAIETGVRLLPLSLTLLAFAVGVAKLFPNVSPRRVARIGFVVLFAGLVVLIGLLDIGAGAEMVTGRCS